MQAAQPGDRKLAQLRAPEQKLPEVMDGSLWQERSKPQRAPLPPAAVTGLMFLQVPPYPEVFRDSLHTFKLNEQDTDVRAALPPPVSAQPSRGHPHAHCPPQGTPPSISPAGGSSYVCSRPLSPQTIFCLPPPPAPAVSLHELQALLSTAVESA